MKATRQLHEHKDMGLRKSLRYTGISNSMWYYRSRPRTVPPNPDVLDAVRAISEKRPRYGTRRMAAQISRESGTRINRKQIQRIYRNIGYIEPKKTKKEIICAGSRLFKPEAPDQLWETDITYVSCGTDGWCYCFNVIDCFTRQWMSYTFETSATRDMAVASIVDAVAAAKPDCPGLRLRTDNGTQYASRDFRNAVKALDIGRHEFIFKNTPEQNGHIESFHKTLKHEYLWPHEFASYQEAAKILAEAFADYNRARIHSSIGYLTPHEFAAQWRAKNK